MNVNGQVLHSELLFQWQRQSQLRLGNKRCLRITYCYRKRIMYRSYSNANMHAMYAVVSLCVRCLFVCCLCVVVRAGCLCHTRGATDLNCHLFTGQCSCQPNVRGQACDECMVSVTLGVINNNNIDFYTAHTPEIQINVLYNANIMHNKIKI